eukprot:SAG11_NODE_251_length_11596_cov_5.592763_4_plen_180_part_00
MEFFGRRTAVLDVPGRTYPVDLEYKPPPESSSSAKELVPACLEALEEHAVGNLMAFLPGQREVDTAVKSFTSAAPKGMFVALPLYGGLPSEEQARVTDWSEDTAAGKRMVVFCTNVAETSLTIPGVRIVVDTVRLLGGGCLLLLLCLPTSGSRSGLSFTVCLVCETLMELNFPKLTRLD